MAKGLRLRFLGIQFLHSLDRRNVNGNYSLTNVHWATPKEQANNMRSSAWNDISYRKALRGKIEINGVYYDKQGRLRTA